MPPDFADVEYWNARFLTETEPFEWLKHPDYFIPYVKAALEKTPEANQNVLHIGPGSSTLSLGLRRLVSDPRRIHNVDYSESAIDLGKSMESRAFENKGGPGMKWTCGDLLDSSFIASLSSDDLFSPQYSLIVDKSAVDSIACGADAVVNSRLFRTPSLETMMGSASMTVRDQESKMHPATLLSLHLAALAAPGACWLCLSYSGDRFSFLSGEQEHGGAVTSPDPRRFWKLTSKEEVSVNQPPECSLNASLPVHRPKFTYWFYVLERTDVGLALVA